MQPLRKLFCDMRVTFSAIWVLRWQLYFQLNTKNLDTSRRRYLGVPKKSGFYTGYTGQRSDRWYREVELKEGSLNGIYSYLVVG